MALFTLNEGSHYHQWPPFSTLPWVGERKMSRTVTFSPECAYDLPAYNSDDVNKLFGLSFGFGGVHHNSARFGWRWSKADQCIELLAYVYNEGVRNQDLRLRFPVVAQVKPGVAVILTIFCLDENDGQIDYDFWADFTDETGKRRLELVTANAPAKLPHFGLTHGVFFGGSLPCPHKMSVRIDR